MTNNEPTTDVIEAMIATPSGQEYHITNRHPAWPGTTVAVKVEDVPFNFARILSPLDGITAETPATHLSALTVVTYVSWMDEPDQPITRPVWRDALAALVVSGARFVRMEYVDRDDLAASLGIGFNAVDGAPYDVTTHDSFGDRLPEAE